MLEKKHFCEVKRDIGLYHEIMDAFATQDISERRLMIYVGMT